MIRTANAIMSDRIFIGVIEKAAEEEKESSCPYQFLKSGQVPRVKWAT
jgi:hypothetical protein